MASRLVIILATLRVMTIILQELISEAASLDSMLSEAIMNVTLILDSTREALQVANSSLQVGNT